MQGIKILIILMLIKLFCDNVKSDSNDTILSTSEFNVETETISNVLSRKKRFLIFPDGSSFQVVFCTQNHGYLQLGNIVWFGNTAALAWELPTDPSAFDMFRDRYKVYEGSRRSDVLVYVDEDGKVVQKMEYKRKITVNPAFAKRSADATTRKDERIKISNLKKRMHEIEKNKFPLKGLDGTALDLHRKDRQKLYVKLEKFLQTLGWNGKECVLKFLCKAGKQYKQQTSLVGEIIRAIFTLPSVSHPKSEVHKQYDEAHGTNGDCTILYPNCGDIPTL